MRVLFLILFFIFITNAHKTNDKIKKNILVLLRDINKVKNNNILEKDSNGYPKESGKINDKITISKFVPGSDFKEGVPWLPKLFYYNDEPATTVKTRRQYEYSDNDKEHGSSQIYSTGSEEESWKQDFQLQWADMKLEAIKAKELEPPQKGTRLNAEVPWRVPCGDPVQHDLPWGTCVMPASCDPEFRVYRGDLYCGKILVCCAVMATSHNLFQGLDVSLVESDESTLFHKKKYRSPDEKIRLKRMREKNKRLHDRKVAKKVFKTKVKHLISYLRKGLNKAVRNATMNRDARTAMMERFIDNLKKKFKYDAEIAKDLREYDVKQIDKNLLDMLSHVHGINDNYLQNSTFRDALLSLYQNYVDHRLDKTEFDALPQFENRNFEPPAVNESLLVKANGTRRSGLMSAVRLKFSDNNPLEYDVEYGVIYV